jgi:hypothetical protein
LGHFEPFRYCTKVDAKLAEIAPLMHNDEDITSMDTTILVTSCPKVNQLYIKMKFDTFEQLMLHYDFVAFSFSELLDWIKPYVKITWKTRRTKEIDWGPSPSLANVLHQATTSLLVQGKEESNPTRFGYWIRTTGQNQVVTAAMTSYGLRLGSS